MHSVSSEYANRLRASPDSVYAVMITQKPGADEPDFTGVNSSIQPIEGLTGIYKASLTGHEILRLQHNEAIQTIEPDGLDLHALGEG